MANIIITVTTPDGRTLMASHTSHHDGFPVRKLLQVAAHLHEQVDVEVQAVDDADCTCDATRPLTGDIMECPSCGISRSNARQNDFWQRVGRD